MDLLALEKSLEGEFHYDQLMKVLYATDASVYRELPLAVAIPRSKSDIKKLIQFANKHKTSLIPRAAGTSLAGQCVGDGIVVDISKYFNKIIDFNQEENWVIVEPGVVRDELNAFLKPHGYFFSPVTSTANRAMIGGMVGNNASGTSSIEYGTTRDHLLELRTLISDGSEVCFKALTPEEFETKSKLETLEGKLYRHIKSELDQKQVQQNIREQFPKATIHRRNTGYAVDYLLNSSIFSDKETPFNFCKLLCGSEGTLAFTTSIKIHVDPLPPANNALVAIHFNALQESLKATQLAMEFKPSACELMDKIILDCTKENIEYNKLRYFVEGDPAAILMVEFRAAQKTMVEEKVNHFIRELKNRKLGYAFPIIHGAAIKNVWKLRAAGLGLLSNIPGDKKAVACIEDTAVAVDDLPAYIDEFSALMQRFGQQSVYYAHAGAGELHLRPILDLKKSEEVKDFYAISEASAKLVKKYKGSLSGEHGDGRVRAPFIPKVVGPENYQLFQRIKKTWDPQGIFNPGKIVDPLPMTTALRYEPDIEVPAINTLLDFSNTNGILRAAEKCNGSGDCRKLPLSGGTMCPSYQATRNEKDTTRARANTLREFLTKSSKSNPFDHQEIKAVMDLCISCKGCTSECPSNVDMAGLKAEFLYQYYKSNSVPLRAKIFANINKLNQWGSIAPGIYNFLLTNKLFSGLAKKILRVASERSLPRIAKQSLIKWYQKKFPALKNGNYSNGQIYLFCDEFTNWNDTTIGIKSILLLDKLGYEVLLIAHEESGRAALSKGVLKSARKYANRNVQIFYPLLNDKIKLIGIEPSAILSFRDEYPRLVDESLRSKATRISKHTLLIEEFISQEIKAQRITADRFSKSEKQILLHGHCHQKALAKIEDSVWMLSLPENYNVTVIPSGCCGMAGSFGYEKEHYKVSLDIANLVLFPAIKNASPKTIVAASGTSCRHQIKDGLKRIAHHPIEILFEALNKV